MTIIHLSSSLGGGGAEQMVLQLSKQSNPTIKTIVISISSVNTLENKFINENIEVHFLNVTSFRNSSLPRALKKLNQIIKDIDDVVFHCHQFHGGLFGVLHNIFYKKRPIAYTMHTNKVTSISRRWCLFITKPFRRKDIIFSENSNKWYLKNSAVIPNGVNFEALSYNGVRSYDESKPFIFLFLGRLSTPKNPLVLISLAEQLKSNKIDNFVINIVGEGNMRKELSNKISGHQLQTHFNLLGFQDRIKQFLNEAHCLILPSLWEGMPVAIIEAAAAKLPVIATPVGSIPDFLNHSNASVTTLEHFHKEMLNVIQNYDKALIRSEKLYEDIGTMFNIDNVYNQHIKVYQSIL